MDTLTIPQYEALMKAAALRRVDEAHKIHMQAWANRAVKAEKKAGKNKTKPVYRTFKRFFDYDAEIKKVRNYGKSECRFAGIGKLLKKGE